MINNKPTLEEMFDFLDSLQALSTINEELSSILVYNFGIPTAKARDVVDLWEAGLAI